MTTATSDIYSLSFFRTFAVENYTDATIALREAIGQVKSLFDSLVGKNPTCARVIKGFNARKHAEVRKYHTPEEVVDYGDYMIQLIEECIDGDIKPSFTRLQDGFLYVTASRSALIMIERQGNRVIVAGRAKFKNPDIAQRNLQKKGFHVDLGIVL